MATYTCFNGPCGPIAAHERIAKLLLMLFVHMYVRTPLLLPHVCLQEVDYSANEIEEMPDLSIHQSLQKLVLDGEYVL